MTRGLAILLIFCASLFGAEPGAKVFPFPYTQEDLPNGLRLVTIPTGFPNIVSLYIVVQVGARHEVEPGKSGYAHLFEHLMFRGTPAYPADKYGAILKAAGADQNASTGPDLTTYYINFSKEDLETMVKLEADRFQNLKYGPEIFKTETRAVLGEYNKSVADPSLKLFEALQETAFTRHPYKHLTIGTLADIQDMPNQYEYGIQFFQRYYRPEYTTIIVAGDVTPAGVKPLVQKYWGSWKRGNHKADIPAEPRQEEPRESAVNWPTTTLPLMAIAYHSPAFSDKDPDWAALNLLAYLGFSSNSELYQKLVIQEQKVDELDANLPGSPDPYLFSVSTRIKNANDIRYVKDQILATLETFAQKPVEKDRLETVKQHLRNQYSLSLNNTQSAAVAAARALRGGGRDLGVIDRLYALYARITPEDIQKAAQKYLHDKNRTVVTLTGGAR